MSSKAKGRRTLNKAKQYLLDEGYIVDEVELGGRFRSSKDLFSGLCTKCWNSECTKHDAKYRFEGFDLIALRQKLPQLLFVQVKTNQAPTQRNYKMFASYFATKNIRVVVMTWHDRKGFVIQTYNKSGTITTKDLRT